MGVGFRIVFSPVLVDRTTRCVGSRCPKNCGHHCNTSSDLTFKLIMCRNIKTLYNFDPPATTDEVNASALQFVRKLSGFNKPSKANEEAFELAIERVAAAAQEMLNSYITNAPPRDREIEAAKARERASIRYGTRP
jgi:hypothetical protein